MLLLTAYFSFKGQSETWLSFSHLELTKSHKGMYKLSYVVRVSADDLDELKRRCDEVKDFYDDLNGFVVKKGSTISDKTTKSCPEYTIKKKATV